MLSLSVNVLFASLCIVSILSTVYYSLLIVHQFFITLHRGSVEMTKIRLEPPGAFDFKHPDEEAMATDPVCVR